MIVSDFVIPLHFEDLEDNEGGQVLVSEVLTVKELTTHLANAANAEAEEGSEFILDHFATFYSLIKMFKDAPDAAREKGWKLLVKSFEKMTKNLGIMLEEQLDLEIQPKICNIVKMLSYLLIELAKRFQDLNSQQFSLEVKGKGKKAAKQVDTGSDFTEEKMVLIEKIYDFLQLPIKMLWEPPVVDEEFVNLFANYCYKCLEDPSITGVAMKSLRSSLFQVLGLLIKKHMHGLSFCVKVVQLLRLHDHLVVPLAQGVVELAEDGCNNIVKEIVREIGETDDMLLSESGSARSLSQFLATVAENCPSAVASAVDLLMAFLHRDPPTLRCCVLSVLGDVVQAMLTKEDLDAELKAIRDSHLDALEEHIHDSNAFVRTRSLQVWQKLCLSKSIPVARIHRLLELIIGRLGDKSSYVKKQAVQLIKVLLEGNPYSGQLDVNDIEKQIKEEKLVLTNFLKAHKLGSVFDEDDWDNRLKPQLKSILSKTLENPIGDDENDDGDGLKLEEAFQIIGRLLSEEKLVEAVRVLNRLREEFYAQLPETEGEDDVESSLQLLRKIWEQAAAPLPTEVPEISDDLLEKKETLERRVTYLKDALDFAKLIDRALPLILTLLDSNAQSDVLESISFFTAAYQFGFARALDGVRRMLYLATSKEPAIKTAVCNAYKDLYFSSNANQRKRSVEAIQKLSELMLQLNLSQMDVLEEVVREWVKSDVINKACIQVLFERFSLKISGTSDAQSWAALALISMIGGEQPKVIRSNMQVLISEGLGPRGAKNFLIASYACIALQKLAADGTRLNNNEEVFMRLRRLLREGIWSGAAQSQYIPFADEAVALVFMLAERPDAFIEELVIDMFQALKSGKRPVTRVPKGRTLATSQDADGDLFGCSQETEDEKEAKEVSIEETGDADMSNEAILLRLTRFISILGTVAAHYVGFLENRILGELKRRNTVEFERKLKRGLADTSLTVDKEELEFARIAADDSHAEEIRRIAEDQVVAGESLLAKFLPFILAICRQPGKFPCQPLQNAALLALGMFMQVSSKVCDENLQLLVTIMEKSQTVDKRKNGLLLLWALQYRFPNSLEPWTSHMFALLSDPEPSVRMTAVRVLTNLIVNEMVKARTHLSDLAICLVDKDIVIAQTSRHFFHEYAQKGNSLFNVLPTLVSGLTSPTMNLEEDDFRAIMKFLMELVTKDKQQELLVEKLCQYFECATTDRQCRDLSYCLSLLHFSDKALKKVLDNFRCFGSKLYLAEVYEAFNAIIAAGGKNPQKDKNVIDELQALIQEYREKSCIDRNISVTIQTKKCPPSMRKRAPRRRQVSSGSEEDIGQAVPQSAVKTAPRSTRKAVLQRKRIVSSDSEPENKQPDSEDEIFVKKTSRPVARKILDAKSQSSDSDSGERTKKSTRTTNPGTAKKTRNKSQFVVKSDSEKEDEKEVRRPIRSARKRR